jgi:hypothetical protein
VALTPHEKNNRPNPEDSGSGCTSEIHELTPYKLGYRTSAVPKLHTSGLCDDQDLRGLRLWQIVWFGPKRQTTVNAFSPWLNCPRPNQIPSLKWIATARTTGPEVPARCVNPKDSANREGYRPLTRHVETGVDAIL